MHATDTQRTEWRKGVVERADLAGDYDAKDLDIVKERLQEACVRLAAILEAKLE